MIVFWAGLVAVILSFGISFLATPLAGRVANRFGLIDIPGRHKAHVGPTPLLGGCAIFAAILGPSLLALAMATLWANTSVPFWLPESISRHVAGAAEKATMGVAILGGAFILHVVGIIDDRYALGPWAKLAAQIVVCSVVVIWFDVRILTIAGPAVSCTLSIIWLVLITNSFNFLDNMDGLSAGVAAICCLALLGASASIGQIFVTAWVCLMLGSLLGFLIWNFPPAKIFMGDAGSLVIGYMMGVLSCLTTYVQWGQPHYLYGMFVPVVLLAMPLYDTLSVIIIRLREGRNPMIGDRHHFSHRLLRRGMSVRSTVLTIYMVTAATAIAATLLSRVADSLGAILILVQTIAILAVVALLELGDAK